MGPMLGLPNVPNNTYVQIILLIPVLICGFNLIKDGFMSLIRLHPNMNSLVFIGCFSSIAFSVYNIIIHQHNLYFESSAIIIMFISIGKTLENCSKSHTGDAINSLLKTLPKKTTIIIDGNQKEIDVTDIKVGDVLVLKPGESVAVDGVIISGFTTVNESMFTGESMPVDKNINDKVIGGSINYNGTITYKAECVGEKMLLNKIVKLVYETQATKAPIQRIADKIAGIFVPTVIIIALLSSIIWLFVGKSFEFALQIFVSVLVIACPCSLGLATPMAIMVGTGIGAKNGALFKTAESVETLNKINCIAFDKTGTLTYGNPKVVKVVSKNKDYMLSLVCSLEKLSNHPLAKAVVEYSNNIKTFKVAGFKSIDGMGLKGIIDGKEILVGNSKFISERFNTSQTSIGIKYDNEFLGYIIFADKVREEAADVIKHLSKNKKIIMLSGDNKSVTENIAKKVEISSTFSNLLPIDKVEIIDKLLKKYKVAMVGDGVNDSPALKKADIGISVMNGTDIAAESSDIILMNENLNTVLNAFSISKITMNTVKENLFWAFCYNCICIPVAAGALFSIGILLNPMICAMAMSLSSVSVVLNSLRINRKIKKEIIY